MTIWGILIFLIGLGSGYTVSAAPMPQTTIIPDSIPVWANRAMNNTDLTIEKRKALVKRAYRQNTFLKDLNKKVKNLSRISLAYSDLGDSLRFRKTNKELIGLANQLKDDVAHGEAHWDLGYFLEKSQPDSAYYHFKEAYNLFKKVNYSDELLTSKKDYPGRMLMAMASVREKSKDYIGAEKEVISSIEEFKSIGANPRLFRAYNILGIIQEGLEKYDKALEYYAKAQEYLPYFKGSKQEENRLRLLNNIAYVQLNKGAYQKAFDIYNNLEKEALPDHKGLLIKKGYTSKAISGFKSGQLGAEEALAYIEKSNHGLDSLGNIYDLARNEQYAAQILWANGEPQKAISKARQAKEIAKNTGNNDRLLEILKFLSQTDTENSAQHSKAYFEISEQLQMQERTIQDKFARIQMETDEILKENEFLARRTQLLAGVAIGLLLLGIGVFIIISQRNSNQRLKFKQKQQENNQEIYNLMLAQHGKMEEGKKSEQKRVSEELHDGILGQMLGIRLVLSGLNERNDPAAIEQRAELIVKLQELEEEIRTISHELNASAYEKVYNFILSIQDLIQTVEKSSNIAIEFEHDTQFEWDSLHSDIKINSYRIVQEVLQNCVKHAQCENIKVAFRNNKNLLNLTVVDDGVGFDDSKAKKGIGLKNIISRVKKMGAQLEIKSKASHGTKVIITIPNIDLKKQHPKSRKARNTVTEA